MAELPEVETMRRDLKREVVGRRLEAVRVWQSRMRHAQDPQELEQRAAGRAIRAVARRGKYLLLDLDGAEVLVIHRGMTGNLFLRDPSDPPDAHLHLQLRLDDGRELRLCDHRGFGEMRILSPSEAVDLSARLGPEPLGPDFGADYLTGEFGRRSALVKALLLNQTIVAGLGNIYVDESLWEAAVHPARRANTLSETEVGSLRDAVVRLLEESIERRGTTFSDYRDLYGRPGGNASNLRVFHRAGQPCLRCGETIQWVRAAGRGSSVCPACQPPPNGAA